MLDEATADRDPIRQLTSWLDTARGEEIENADAMALATAGGGRRDGERGTIERLAP